MGTIVRTAPDGQSYTTRPGSRLLFPTLCRPTAPVAPTAPATAVAPHTGGLRMPRRARTRAEDRARRIDEERHLNETGPPNEWDRAGNSHRSEATSLGV